MISDRPLLLYLHIPKTAGSSLTSAIYNQYNDATGSREEGGWFREGIYFFPGDPGFVRPSRTNDPNRLVDPSSILRALRRNDLRVVAGHFSFGLHTLTNRASTYGTMLRDPFDRIVSLYYHLRRWPTYGLNWLERVGLRSLEAETSLDDFISNYPLPELDNDQTRRLAGEDPEFGGCTRSLLGTAKSNLERHFSFIGITERYEESLWLASHVLSWSVQRQPNKQLVNETRVPISMIPRKTRDAILERNALDLELYSFAKRWLEDRLA
jgi:hypothetical protein